MEVSNYGGSKMENINPPTRKLPTPPMFHAFEYDRSLEASGNLGSMPVSSYTMVKCVRCLNPTERRHTNLGFPDLLVQSSAMKEQCLWEFSLSSRLISDRFDCFLTKGWTETGTQRRFWPSMALRSPRRTRVGCTNCV